jgi:hypothetical protein
LFRARRLIAQGALIIAGYDDCQRLSGVALKLLARRRLQRRRASAAAAELPASADKGGAADQGKGGASAAHGANAEDAAGDDDDDAADAADSADDDADAAASGADDSLTHESVHRAASEDHTFNYTFKVVNNVYRVSVVERSWRTGAVRRQYTSEDVVVKYVRREVRALVDSDRERLLDAMKIMYTTPLIEGRKLYGDKFVDAGYIAAVHNTDEFCFHGGDMFVTTHAAFQLWAEQSLRSIDETLPSMPYWDFMIDGEKYGEDWTRESPIYQDDWWGKVDQKNDTDWQVTEGRWAFTRMSTHGPTEPFLLGQQNS